MVPRVSLVWWWLESEQGNLVRRKRAVCCVSLSKYKYWSTWLNVTLSTSRVCRVSSVQCSVLCRAANYPSVFTIMEKAPTWGLLALSHLRHHEDTMQIGCWLECDEAATIFLQCTPINSPHCQEFMVWRIFSVVTIDPHAGWLAKILTGRPLW